MPQNDVHVVTTGSSGAATRARRALLGVYKAVRALGTHRGKRTATVAGILRDGKRHRAAARRVTWPTVYVREAYEARGAQGEDVEANTPATLGAHLFRHAALLRTPALTYDLVVIPLRVALPEVFVGSAGALAVDVLFDVWGAIALCLDVSQPSRGANDATVGLAGKFAPPDEYGHSDGQKGAARRFRLAREVAANVAHYVGWAVFAQTHRVEVFMAAQLVRCLRMADLLAFLKAVNNDLTSNVRLLAMSKFSLILFFVPHWVACAWLLVADGWHIWDSNDMQLPSWPAQFELVTGNPLLDANEITLKQRCERGARGALRVSPRALPCVRHRARGAPCARSLLVRRAHAAAPAAHVLPCAFLPATAHFFARFLRRHACARAPRAQTSSRSSCRTPGCAGVATPT